MIESLQDPSILSLQTIADLNRKLKLQTTQFNNEKLLLEHKNELLRQEMLELREREINQTKLHEAMFSKIVEQSADPNEFLSQQIDKIKELNTKEINFLKAELISKDSKIMEINRCYKEAQAANENLTYKTKEFELKIRELELQIKIVKEDRDCMESENSFLTEELLAAKNKLQSNEDKKLNETISFSNDKFSQKVSSLDQFCISELEDQIHSKIIDIENSKKIIEKLKSKIK